MRSIFSVIPSMAMVMMMVDLAMLATTLALNLFATLAIAGCMLAVRRRKHVYGGSTHRAMATTALLAGSAAVYTILGAVSALYQFQALGAAAPIAALWQILAVRMLFPHNCTLTDNPVQFLSPSLIILRVVLGVSFDSDSVGSEHTLRSFGTPPAPSYSRSSIEKERPVIDEV
jgi:hypothetical protein